MAKKDVDGVYDADPNTNAGARRFLTLSYIDALNRRLQVMDSTALTLCMEHSLPVVVFNIRAPASIERAAAGEEIGTRVGDMPTAIEEEAPARAARAQAKR
jgi:uridylate kinase